MAATVANSPDPTRFFRSDTDAMNTLPDPRTPSPSTPLSRSDSIASGQAVRHPDLTDEVAMLSTKLVNAINHQTNLDDSLQGARHELDIARQHIVQLEATTRKHEELISGGLLLRRDDVNTTIKAAEKLRENEQKRLDKERKEERERLQKEWDAVRKQLLADAVEAHKLRSIMEREKVEAVKQMEQEQAKRAVAEKEKKQMEQELESLTAQLFEEANGMVASARKETEASEKKSEQLRSQLKDAEILLHSHQEQLQDLKAVVEKISSERDENESNAQISTAPSTPGMAPSDKMSRIFESASLTPVTAGVDEIVPDQPLRFSHLINPVLRHDLGAYEDFKNLLKAAIKATPAPSRVASGSFGSVNVLGLDRIALERSDSVKSSPGTPNFPTISSFPSSIGGYSRRETMAVTVPPLKDTPVYKRALAEDIEPTLRLDAAPGIGWMAKRTVINSITAGNLVVEPMPASTSKFHGPIFSCALCGENRKGEQYTRRHRFRASEAEDAARYPLCDYCLGRVRMTCDYIAFLRMVRDGHWRAETDEEINAAWEESVKLRERMFWQRIGGGVVPAYLSAKDSPRIPMFAQSKGRDSEDSQQAPALPPRNSDDSQTPPLPPRHDGPEDPFNGIKTTKRVSIGKTFISPDVEEGQESSYAPLTAEKEQAIDEAAAEQLQDDLRHSISSKSSGAATITDDVEHETVEPTRATEPLSTTEPITLAAESPAPTFSSPVESPFKEMQRLSLTIPGAF
ncbi:Sec2p-domain-containing protein [Venturia nashicola]|uniref:Sec2p-domain-containing protein n=1 Tax=Venturia nashicola TaxID=86259 RepID=A0A4Z1NWF9_9PEZI|nr:Sec2p-domain-containing protein [Venturia nashicola]